jgi:hypothetical protein
MARLTRHVFQCEPQLATYLELVDYCCLFASHLVVVVPDVAARDGAGTAPVTRKLAALTPFLTAVSRSAGIPGVRERDAIVCRHRTSPGLRDAMKGIASRLFEWASPELPEDPCFLREDGAALLVTVTRARDGYLMLRDAEVQVLRREYPRLADIVQPQR